MKTTGIYSFLLGDGGGQIEVIDLVRLKYREVTAEQGDKILKNLHPFITT